MEPAVEPIKSSVLAHADDDAFLLAYLAACDEPCPVCGYNVHALTVPRCTECGHSLRLRVVSAEGVSRAWVGLLATLAAGAGVGLLIVVALLHDGWPRGNDFARQLVFDIVLSYFLAMIPAALVGMALRRPFGRLKMPWVVTGAVAIMTAAMLLLFLWNIEG